MQGVCRGMPKAWRHRELPLTEVVERSCARGHLLAFWFGECYKRGDDLRTLPPRVVRFLVNFLCRLCRKTRPT